MSKTYEYEYNSAPCRIFADYGSVKMIEFDNGQRTAVPGELVKKISEQVISARNILGTEKKEKPVEKDGLSIIPPEKPAVLFDTEAEVEKPNINELTFSDLVDLKGVGRASAKKIIENKPSEGYKTLEQLKALNDEINRLDWNVVAEQVSF